MVMNEWNEWEGFGSAKGVLKSRSRQDLEAGAGAGAGRGRPAELGPTGGLLGKVPQSPTLMVGWVARAVHGWAQWTHSGRSGRSGRTVH